MSLVGDFVYMRRTQIHDKPLVKSGSDHTVINTQDLVHHFEFEPGYRVAFMLFPCASNSLEGSFLYLQPWHGSRERDGNGSLYFPFKEANYSHDFTDASAAKAFYESQFWDAELNYWWNMARRNRTYFGLSALFGLRYFNWDESFRLTMARPPYKSSYHIRTENKLSSLQVGLDFQMNPTGGLLGNVSRWGLLRLYEATSVFRGL